MDTKLQVYWFGYGGHKKYAEELRPIIEELGMELKTISEWEDSDIKFERETWINHLRNADIIILPTDYEKWPGKSNNKLTQAMALEKPVIASSLPAYERIYKEHENSFLIANKDEWKEKLEFLRDNEEARKELAKNALEASKEFSIDSIGNQWIELFDKLEKVDIIIPTYNNLECLKLCLDSIRNCTDVLYNIIVIKKQVFFCPF